jgi:BlaI family penicillinase repressor
MPPKHYELSRRERQIMDVIFARGEATAADVAAALPDPPSYSAVRAMLRILEEKGALKHREDGPRYVFLPTESRARASRSALQRVVQTFFDGSLASAVAALVDARDGALPPEELERLEAIIKKAKKTLIPTLTHQ